ncbi:unnamed protein product [Sphenostylis stenocarpa]|uniref:Uncharacterized protein n=1 Tax=Sphenostylis stenocarpa TaxID=92480 RepID=A0AA86VA09_9FABA|nr:unnamed protein product [Sphenostylis stenocarpa]
MVEEGHVLREICGGHSGCEWWHESEFKVVFLFLKAYTCRSDFEESSWVVLIVQSYSVFE